LFVGEAPGRLGADGSGIPFHGDKAGHNFEALLAEADIDRHHTFVTNAVLCNPKDQNGNNSTPSPREVSNCSSFLRRQIEMVGPSIVVSLGATALKALHLIEPHHLTLQKDVRTVKAWCRRKLIPIYHPGQRAMIHRSFRVQQADYRFIAEEMHKDLGSPGGHPHGSHLRSVDDVLRALLAMKPQLSYRELHQLFYLLECLALKRDGRRLTRAYIVRGVSGPYCTDLHLFKLRKRFPALRTSQRGQEVELSFSEVIAGNVDSPLQGLIRDLLSSCGKLNAAQLDLLVNATGPMQMLCGIDVGNDITINAPLFAVS
jgi:uracil-DNA glycosylase family 4